MLVITRGYLPIYHMFTIYLPYIIFIMLIDLPYIYHTHHHNYQYICHVFTIYVILPYIYHLFTIHITIKPYSPTALGILSRFHAERTAGPGTLFAKLCLPPGAALDHGCMGVDIFEEPPEDIEMLYWSWLEFWKRCFFWHCWLMFWCLY